MIEIPISLLHNGPNRTKNDKLIFISAQGTNRLDEKIGIDLERPITPINYYFD